MSCSGGGRIPLTKEECHESGTPLLIAKVKKLIEDIHHPDNVGKEVHVVDEVFQKDIDRDWGPGYLKGCYVYDGDAAVRIYRIYYNTGNGANPATTDRSQQQAICKDRVTG